LIYFIQDSHSKAIKIGHARHPDKRLGDLQVGAPHVLTLLGTLPGGPMEEALIHDQFEPFHLRGEWFKGETELMELIRLLLFQKGRPSTVWDEARRRGGCRDGLKGVVIGVIGWSESYRIWCSHWGAGRQLLLSVYGDFDPPPRHHWVGPKTPEEERTLELGIIRGNWIGTKWVTDYPESFIKDMQSDQCVLLSEWPITCCEPDQRLEDWDNP
jgi:Meiotically Up-regulated Gene 113 (MUG113) protein